MGRSTVCAKNCSLAYFIGPEQSVRWMMIECTIVVKCVGRRSAAAIIIIIIIEYSIDICVRNKTVFAFGFSEWI